MASTGLMCPDWISSSSASVSCMPMLRVRRQVKKTKSGSIGDKISYRVEPSQSLSVDQRVTERWSNLRRPPVQLVVELLVCACRSHGCERCVSCAFTLVWPRKRAALMGGRIDDGLYRVRATIEKVRKQLHSSVAPDGCRMANGVSRWASTLPQVHGCCSQSYDLEYPSSITNRQS